MGVKNGKYVNCEWCGKEIYRTQYRLKLREHHFCSNKCQFEKKHFEIYEDSPCEVCGKMMHLSKCSSQRFCSIECQHEWQKTNVGTDNAKFTRKLIKCSWCGKEFYVKNYKISKFDHLFCCNECRREWYAKIWSQTDEWREESRKRATRILEERKIDVNTKPQVAINELLKSKKINYKNEYNCTYYSIDNYLTDYNLMIEVMGDFWHCSPLKYKRYEANNMQDRRIYLDALKKEYIYDNYGVNILYLWEKDINKNIKLCEKLIELYINNNGLLEDYHSFNYELDKDDIILKNEIIKAYF